VFHLGGDDHIAIGPREYLNGITAEHRRIGGQPSMDKHGISKVAVVYTENLLYFRDKIISIPVNDVDRRYDESIFIDSIKVRNLSPFRKGSERENEVSSWIGKCKATAGSIAYLKGNMKLKGRIAISRLLYRFQRNLPKEHQSSMKAVIAMPVPLGGLGMTVNLERSAENLPILWRKAFNVILRGEDTSLQVRRALTGMWKPHGQRGIQTDGFLDNVEGQILERFARMSLDEVREIVDPEQTETLARVFYMAKEKGYYPADSLRELVEKPYVVRRLLQVTATDKTLRVLPMRFRMRACWNKLEAMPLVVNSEPILGSQIGEAAKMARGQFFVNLNEETTIAVDPTGSAVDTESDSVDWSKVDFKEVTLKAMLLQGAPSLTAKP
jgi:hypothetical protein